MGSSPRTRLGTYASSTVSTKFLGKEDLGVHSYNYSPLENNGIVYTCKAGHVDIAHVRIAADWTAYLAMQTFKTLQNDETEFSFRLSIEPSMYFVKITYPDNWQNLSQEARDLIAIESSINLGQFMAFNATTWHEILTWYGFKSVAFISEHASAFSWEDSFSNLIGTHIAAKVLRQSEKNYNKAMTRAIVEELDILGVQSRRVAKMAADNVKGPWYSSIPFSTDIKKRNFDIGIGDGFITPTLVPEFIQCEGAEPLSYPVPNLDVLAKYGFEVKFEIEPREWERNKILSIVFPDHRKRGKRIEPIAHYPVIMDHILQQAAAKYGMNDVFDEQTVAME
jgi:hypothetical protein